MPGESKCWKDEGPQYHPRARRAASPEQTLCLLIFLFYDHPYPPPSSFCPRNPPCILTALLPGNTRATLGQPHSSLAKAGQQHPHHLLRTHILRLGRGGLEEGPSSATGTRRGRSGKRSDQAGDCCRARACCESWLPFCLTQ